jgi:hypothetical protein
MPRLAATYFNPKTGWRVDGAAIYSYNWENPATDYQTGEILNLEGVIAKNFGRLGVGVTGYAVIQTPVTAAPARCLAISSRASMALARLSAIRSAIRKTRSLSSPNTTRSSTPRTRSRVSLSTSP